MRIIVRSDPISLFLELGRVPALVPRRLEGRGQRPGVGESPRRLLRGSQLPFRPSLRMRKVLPTTDLPLICALAISEDVHGLSTCGFPSRDGFMGGYRSPRSVASSPLSSGSLRPVVITPSQKEAHRSHSKQLLPLFPRLKN